MRKFAFFLAPIMAISFLTNCGGKSELKQYSVTVTSEDISKGTVSGGGTFAYNSDVTITAVANTGYKFTGWYDGGTHISNEATYNFKMQANDIAYIARFTANQYTISVTSEDTTKGTVTGSGPFAYNSSVTIKATPNTGYSFNGWYDDETLISNYSTYNFKMPANDISYVAKFTINQYTISVTSEDTTKGTVSGGGTFAYNSDVTIAAIANSGYKFNGWYEGKTFISSESIYKFKMPANDISYEARFVANKYTVALTVSPSDGGTVEGDKSYVYGESVTIKATPNTGYSFEGWYEDNKKLSLPNPCTFDMPANDISYEARFKANQYTVRVTSEDTSKGLVSGEGTFAYNSDVAIAAIANSGYKFNGWYEGKTFISSESIYKFKMPAKNVTYTAKFANENAWFFKTDWWKYCSSGKDGEQATTADIGQEVNLTVNNQIHKVRLIGVGHDDLYDGSGKAHCTFEFSNLLSDSNGYSLATFWSKQTGQESTNYNYLDSNLRKALDGYGNGILYWYQKDSITKSDISKSAYDMLPNELQSKIKTVKKQVACSSSYIIDNYEAKVFALTHDEMTESSSEYAKDGEGTTYQYYKDHDNASSRIKYQVKRHDGAATSYSSISDLPYPAYNYAGYNDSEETYGSYYLLTSPNVSSEQNAWNVNCDGEFDYYYTYVYSDAHAVAPAFCI